jgi:hypothetical protein
MAMVDQDATIIERRKQAVLAGKNKSADCADDAEE